MAASYVGTRFNAGEKGNLTLQPHASTSVGDLLLVGWVIEDGNTKTLTPPAGYTTQLSLTASDGTSLAVYSKLVSTTAELTTGVVFSFSNTTSLGSVLAMMSFRGTDSANQIGDISSTVHTASISTVVAPSIVCGRSAALLVTLFGVGGLNCTFSVQDASMNEMFDENAYTGFAATLAGAYKVVDPGTTSAQTALASAGGAYRGIGVSVLLYGPPVTGFWFGQDF